jgi:hypothetical protein
VPDIGGQPPGASYIPADWILSRRTFALAVSGPLHGNQTGRKVKIPDSLSGLRSGTGNCEDRIEPWTGAWYYSTFLSIGTRENRS